MFRRKVTLAVSLAGLTTLAMCGFGCASKDKMAEAACRGGQIHYAQGSGELYRLYEYYPNCEVYYGVYNYNYYWREGARWVSDYRLPENFTLDQRNRKLVELPTGKPYTRHENILAMYPTLDQLRLAAAKTETGAETETAVFASVHTEH